MTESYKQMDKILGPNVFNIIISDIKIWQNKTISLKKIKISV